MDNIFQSIVPVITFLTVLISGFILRRILFRRFLHWASRTKSHLDDIVIASTKGPFIIWCAMFGIYFAFKTSQLPDEAVRIAGKILLVLGITSVTIVLSNISAALIKVNSGKIEPALPVTSLTRNAARIIIFVVGILVILNSLGISITPILATLGVGGLAVALAIQDTLANFFAGFHIIASRQIKIGDFIRLESGEEGYVTDINWRTTKIRALADNIVLVPNDKLSKALIVNYYLPDKETAVLVNLSVHYKSDLDKVERITSITAKEIMQEVPGGIPEFEPFIRYHTFGDFGIGFTVILRAREFTCQHLIKHEFIKRLHSRYAAEGIIIPYPVRAVNYKQEE